MMSTTWSPWMMAWRSSAEADSAIGADGLLIAMPELPSEIVDAAAPGCVAITSGSMGRNSVKVEPRPGWLDSTISPPSRRAISRLIASPSPVPP
jgi:hypothetical protein